MGLGFSVYMHGRRQRNEYNYTWMLQRAPLSSSRPTQSPEPRANATYKGVLVWISLTSTSTPVLSMSWIENAHYPSQGQP